MERETRLELATLSLGRRLSYWPMWYGLVIQSLVETDLPHLLG